jgi:hypothetical protein
MLELVVFFSVVVVIVGVFSFCDNSDYDHFYCTVIIVIRERGWLGSGVIKMSAGQMNVKRREQQQKITQPLYARPPIRADSRRIYAIYGNYGW